MQPGYYLTHFLDNMKKHMHRHTPADVKKMERLLRDVKSAVCFQLPKNGILFKDDEHLDDMPLDAEGFTRPPYPVVAMEFDFEIPDGSTEHVVLIMIDMPEIVTADGRKGGVYCIPTATSPEDGNWKVPTFGFMLPYTQFGTWSVEGKGWTHHVGFQPFLPDAMLELAEMNEKADRIETFMQEMYEEEIMFYVRGYLHFCAALGMHDVSFTDIEPHKGRNKMRRALGKAPLFTYKVLTIGKKKPKTRQLGGTHASPRSHLRRGHYRTAPKSGRRYWVEPCMVKGETPGFVHKDYRVEGDAA